MILDAIVSPVLFYQGQNSEILSYGLLEYNEAKDISMLATYCLPELITISCVVYVYEIIILLSTIF